MPTVLKEKGFYFFIYSSDRNEPPHVHVEIDRRTAKIWLYPIRLSKNFGLKKHELRFVLQIARDNEKEIKKAWSQFFKKDKRQGS